ncbi:MAG: hypothetical protein GY909_17870 [Oligoflexia bacterium]|nr:hypothetical protein [Oligoflexia bacterium]
MNAINASGISLFIGTFVGSAIAMGSIHYFLDIPSLIVLFLPVPFFLFMKYGKMIRGEELIGELYKLISIMTMVTILHGSVIMLANIKEQAAIGPALSVLIIGLLYGIIGIIGCSIFSKKKIPSYVLITPIVGILVIPLSFFVLLSAF